MGAGDSDSWESSENARMYAAYAGESSIYAHTSGDLVRLADLPPDAEVVDLACGAGTTTRAILNVLGPGGRVVGVDASEAMLTWARSSLWDDRVCWVRSRGEDLNRTRVGRVDVVVCNAAIWQMDMEATFAAVSQVLRTGGRFVFNVGGHVLGRDGKREAPGDQLMALMEALARDEYGNVEAPSAGTVAGRLTEVSLRSALRAAGFEVDQVAEYRYQSTLEEQRAWLSIPVFTWRRFGRLSYGQRMALLDAAYDRLRGSAAEMTVTSSWAVFVASVTAGETT